jgi:hypothetical protein
MALIESDLSKMIFFDWLTWTALAEKRPAMRVYRDQSRSSLCHRKVGGNRTGAPRSQQRTPDFLWSLLVLVNFMRLSLMKAAHVAVGGAPCRKSGYVGRKRWAQPDDRLCLIE